MKHWIDALLVFPLLACAAPGDDAFLAAREAYRVGEPARVARMAATLRATPGGHELEPWVSYWQLALALPEGREGGIDDFLARNSGTYLAEKLRGDWLRAMGRRSAWAEFMPQYALLKEPDAELTCFYWRARLALDGERGVLGNTRTLWLSPDSVPGACLPLIDRLVTEKQLQADDIWSRLRNLLELSRYAEAQSVSAYLPDGHLPDTKTLERIAANPVRYLDRMPQGFAASRRMREAAIFAVLRVARKDTRDAAARWSGMEERFGAADRGYVWGQLARRAALAHQREATAWYAIAGNTTLTEDQQNWRIRSALRERDWPQVLLAISQLPPDMAARPEWIYWRGRALAATGSATEAAALYRTICAQPGFYGLLAAEELGLPLSLPPRAAAPTAEELSMAAANNGLRRALALFRLDIRNEAVREWNWALRGMSDRELLAAAEVARRNDIFDRAISAADRTKTEHDYVLRYLAPYRDAVLPKTQALALDNSWVYGLMRQESRFVTSARSGVGAQGLMQLMPSTAKLVARKIGLGGYRPEHVHDLDTNVTLGTSYLKMVLDSLDNHPVLACTAYNAGPGRAQRWRGDQPLEGAIYAETIPFSETRDYVKKVMANSVYYSALFEEKPKTLKSRLGVIQPRGVVDTVKGDGSGAEP